MSTEGKEVKTTTEEVEIEDIDSLLAIPGAGEGTTSESKKFFENPGEVDTTFIDKPVEDDPEPKNEDDDEDEEEDETKKKKDVSDADDPLKSIIDEVEDEEDESLAGRPKETKEVGIKVVKSLIEEGLLMPYEDDDKPLDEYTEKELIQLYKDNLEEKETSLRDQVSLEFFDSLPKELQMAAKYVADGGTDMQGLFQALGSMKSVESLDASNEDSAERIVYEYLTESGWSAEDAEDEINSWKDAEVLESKAEKFKPKLEGIRQKKVDARMAKQAQAKQAQQKAMDNYVNNIYEALKPGELNGVKLNNKTRDMLYTGLVNPTYDTMKGGKTNLLGHLLEKYQHSEPNYSLIAEATWLLQDPEGYKKEIMNNASNKATEETVKKLKSAQNKASGGSMEVDPGEASGRSVKKRGMKSKKQRNIFK